jgi:hypothetical protein
LVDIKIKDSKDSSSLKNGASCCATDPAVFFANRKSIIFPQTAVHGGLRFVSGAKKL